MKNKKLKSYVLPSLYACFFVGVLFVTIGIANVLTKKAPTNNTNEEINYVSESIVDDDEPVVKEENKILIVLSDGKPNDVKIGKDSSRSIRGEMSYKGIVGIKDTAMEVRKARKRGIMVLGVFTGKEIDLEAEKKIYGKDFIYIKDIQRFSDIVSTYLKKVIIN